MKRILLISIITTFLLVGCPESNIINYSDIGWKPLDFPDKDLRLTDVYFKDTLTGWVTAAYFVPYQNSESNYAAIYHTNDGGKTWQQQLKVDTNYFYEIDFWNENHGYALAQKGILFETKDGGNTWQQKQIKIDDIILTNSLRDIFFQNQDVAWIVGSYKTLLKTTDQGNSWQRISALDTASHYFGIHFFDDNNGIIIGGEDYVGSTDARVLITSDGGKTWETSLFIENSFCRDADYNGDEVIVVGTEGLIAKSTNKGHNWEKINIDVNYPLNSVKWQDENRAWIAGYFGLFYWTDDKGKNWHKYDTGDNVNYYEVNFLDELHGWLVGHFGKILYTNNGGKDIIVQ